jgi:predicted ATPase
VLLVLDNCEHLLRDCTSLVNTLLAGCPRLSILATSREPLGAAGESCWSAPAMGFDRSHASSPGQSRRSDAVSLFVERTHAVWPTFVLSDQNAAAVNRICRRLEGIPLAIELAAARTRVLSVDDLDARLEDRLQVLVMGPAHIDPRHRTLRAALDWSYALLAEDEQRLLERLSVFRGGAVLEAIEAVCRPPQSVAPIVDLVQSVVEKSLITPDPQSDGVIRFRQLEAIREYAGQHLARRGAQDETRDQHLRFFAEFCERAEAAWRSPHEQVWFDRLDREHDNVRAALHWAEQCADRVEAGLRLAAALSHFWAVRGHAVEGRRWLEKLLAAPAAVDSAVHAAALYAAGYLAFENGDYVHAATWAKDALTLRRRLGDFQGIASSLNQLAIHAASQGRFEEAHAGFAESLATSRAAGDQTTVAAALVNLAMTARHLARFDEAEKLLGQSLELFRTLGNRTGENRALHALGNLALDTRDLVVARE